MSPLAALSLALAALVLPWQAADDEHDPTPHVEARLVCAHEQVVPGQHTWLAIRFEIEDGWHLYWQGQNDSGLPVRITLDVPEGWTLGPLVWPVPKRHVSPGDLLDHVYEGQLTILAPLTVASDAPVGPVTIGVRHDWLVCRHACMFGGDEEQLVLTVGPVGSAQPEGAALIQAARKHAPLTKDLASHGLAVRWQGNVVTLHVPGARRLVFLAHQDSTPVVDLLTGGDVRADTMRLTLLHEHADPDTDVQILGMLAIHTARGTPPTVLPIQETRP